MKKNKLLLCSLLSFCMLFLSGCGQELYSDLSEKHVNEMMSILQNNNIKSTRTVKKDGKFGIKVKSNQFSLANEKLREHGYPKESFDSFGDIFQESSIISSPLEEKVKFIYALSQNVSETISQIEGVITARVHIVLPDNDPFAENVIPSSASVFIKYHPQFDITKFKSDIKLIVEKSIQGLSYDKVSVVMFPVSRQMIQEYDSEFGVIKYFYIIFILIILGIFAFILFSKKASIHKEETSPLTSNGI